MKKGARGLPFASYYCELSTAKVSTWERRTFFRRGKVVVMLATRTVVLALLLDPAASLQVFYDSSNALHRDINYHPECPERIDHCLHALRQYFGNTEYEDGLAAPQIIDVAADPEVPSDIQQQEYSLPLTNQEFEHAKDVLAKIHDASYISSLKNSKDSLSWINYVDGPDTYLTPESYDVGVRATGGVD